MDKEQLGQDEHHWSTSGTNWVYVVSIEKDTVVLKVLYQIK